ncbi:hypothetical protein B0H15DRAFT_957506 [Mycena belliarum]|uniref:Uncharacterized protein n=1 Tax=Mycena belliarum TaxID=1033014 RepID=A0AAD6XE95_9AGAR|nr:hypothetical protein B0H15DRAFT_957506 [Mycena belliae]
MSLRRKAANDASRIEPTRFPLRPSLFPLAQRPRSPSPSPDFSWHAERTRAPLPLLCLLHGVSTRQYLMCDNLLLNHTSLRDRTFSQSHPHSSLRCLDEPSVRLVLVAFPVLAQLRSAGLHLLTFENAFRRLWAESLLRLMCSRQPNRK